MKHLVNICRPTPSNKTTEACRSMVWGRRQINFQLNFIVCGSASKSRRSRRNFSLLGYVRKYEKSTTFGYCAGQSYPVRRTFCGLRKSKAIFFVVEIFTPKFVVFIYRLVLLKFYVQKALAASVEKRMTVKLFNHNKVQLDLLDLNSSRQWDLEEINTLLQFCKGAPRLCIASIRCFTLE